MKKKKQPVAPTARPVTKPQRELWELNNKHRAHHDQPLLPAPEDGFADDMPVLGADEVPAAEFERIAGLGSNPRLEAALDARLQKLGPVRPEELRIAVNQLILVGLTEIKLPNAFRRARGPAPATRYAAGPRGMSRAMRIWRAGLCSMTRTSSSV